MATKLNVSVVKAERGIAENLSRKLLSIVTKTGRQPCKRINLQNGFEITIPVKQPDETWNREVIFRFTDGPGPKVEWNPDFVTIG